jgi:hypothetical protein
MHAAAGITTRKYSTQFMTLLLAPSHSKERERFLSLTFERLDRNVIK